MLFFVLIFFHYSINFFVKNTNFNSLSKLKIEFEKSKICTEIYCFGRVQRAVYKLTTGFKLNKFSRVSVQVICKKLGFHSLLVNAYLPFYDRSLIKHVIVTCQNQNFESCTFSSIARSPSWIGYSFKFLCFYLNHTCEYFRKITFMTIFFSSQINSLFLIFEMIKNYIFLKVLNREVNPFVILTIPMLGAQIFMIFLI